MEIDDTYDKEQAEADLSRNRVMWWGYLHQNGTSQVKRWFGDHKDYQDDCHDNPFVLEVVPPFEADSREMAERIIDEKLGAR